MQPQEGEPETYVQMRAAVNPVLTQTQKYDLLRMLDETSVVWACPVSRSCTLEAFDVETWGSQVQFPPRTFRAAIEEEINRQIKEQLANDSIRPHKGAWASPLVPVRKTDGTLRICVDYRRVNRETLKDSYPLPKIKDLFDLLGGRKWKSKLDLNLGYNNFHVTERAADVLVFVCNQGLFAYRVMPFGPCNCPAFFQRQVDLLFLHKRAQGTYVYMDDFHVCSETWEEYVRVLRDVLMILASVGLYVKARKYQFGYYEIEYLEFLCTPQGIQPSQRRVAALDRVRVPKTRKELESLIGMIGYMSLFIPRYSELMEPLFLLRRKGKEFVWGIAQQKAWEQVRVILKTCALLYYPDLNKPFRLVTDAWEVAITAVLFGAANEWGVSAS